MATQYTIKVNGVASNVVENKVVYVAGVSERNDLLRITTNVEYAKKFHRRADAQKFIDKYADPRYGLESRSPEIVPVIVN